MQTPHHHKYHNIANITNTTPIYNVHLTVVSIQNRNEISNIFKIKTLDHLNNQYLKTEWIHIFIDGTSEEAVKIKVQDKNTKARPFK